ncbi:MAG: two-component system response regulator [Dechloromonas sp.]|nr:MAG: two-component system response regulator [Dechloromonas sp.]
MNIDLTSQATPSTILIVDDTPENLGILGEALQPQYRVRAVNSGERALRALAGPVLPDLVLLDVMMPGMDGYEVLRRMQADPVLRAIPVIFVTAMDASESEERGLALGAVDYITKPVNIPIVLARVRAHLELKGARDRLAGQKEWLEREVERRMQENLLIQELSVRALACLGEARDNETGNHIVRTQSYVEVLAEHLADNEGFRSALAGQRRRLIVQAAPLHDIGKVGIPDAILLKPGKLTIEEFAIMKQHPVIGGQAIAKAMRQARLGLGDGVKEHVEGAFTFLEVASEISLGHHEKWDGSGYPYGLAGDAIPVSARLMALADVFDALISRRVYKAPMTMEAATEIIMAGRGSHFDPEVVDAFLACRDRFVEVASRLAEPAEEDAGSAFIEGDR